MLRKFLFIGLGGSGGKTLRFLRHDLQQWLRSVEWEGDDLPAGWQLLHIDTPTVQDGQEVREVEMLPAEQYLGLVSSGVGFAEVSQQLTNAGDEAWRELASWRIDPTHMSVPITTGAGQYRAVGRSIGLAYADRILKRMQRAHALLMNASAAQELSEIHRRAYGRSASPPADPVVVVVSSLAGGTGAGLLMDACDLLRQLPGGWGDNSFGILYASDVFDQLGSLATAGVQPNALSALCELMNGYWLNANHERASALYQASGAPMPIKQSGPKFPFLVGAANTKGVTFGDQKSVYAMMGRALRSWTVDVGVQAKLVEYTKSNWQASAKGNAVKADVLVRDHLPVFEAFGYAEASLGTERFARYATQRLARQAAEFLHHGHVLRSRLENPDDVRTPDEIAEVYARGHLATFLDRCKLNERGDDRNQVIEALQPPEVVALQRAALDDVMGLLQQADRELPAAQWIPRVATLVHQACHEYLVAYDRSLREQAHTWALDVPDRVLAVTSEVVGRFGLDTAARLVDMLGDELRAVSNELHDEAVVRSVWAQEYEGAIKEVLDTGGRIRASHPKVREAVEAGLAVLGGYQAEAKQREVAKQLMRELADGFVVPLAKRLRWASGQLHDEGFQGVGANPPVVRDWPERAVPDRMRPPRNEHLVVDVDDFPGRYDALMERTFVGCYADEVVERARTSVITGDFLVGLPSPRRADLPLRITTPWRPEPALFIGDAAPRSTAVFAADFQPAHLEERAEQWLHLPNSPFERFLTSDLRTFLAGDPTVDPSETSARQRRFLHALGAAIDSAEPLVRIDTALLTLLHKRASATQRAVPSLIPLRDHPLEAEVRQLLADRLGDGAGQLIDECMSTNGRVSVVSISSTLGAAHDPLVFSSITDKIVQGWRAAAANDAGRRAFWESRRARPVVEFVPASQQIILAMTRGWFTGLLLGRIDRKGWRIATSHGVVPLPELLRAAGERRDQLPAVLEALGVAYAEVTRVHDLQPLWPYVELRELGVQPGLVSYESADLYDRVSSHIERFVLNGDRGEAIVDGLAKDAPDAQGRREAVLVPLERARREYAEELVTYRNRAIADPAALGPARAIWPGMAAVIDRALAQLIERVGAMGLHDDDSVM